VDERRALVLELMTSIFVFFMFFCIFCRHL
jgi:hypothetical protein